MASVDIDIDRARRVFIGAVGALSLGSAALLAAKPKERVIEVIARKFEFVPSEIHLQQGETVLLRFTAPEVPMGFNLAEFGLRTDIVPGQIAHLRLTADKSGVFTFLCDVFCGSGHEDMSGTLVVSN